MNSDLDSRMTRFYVARSHSRRAPVLRRQVLAAFRTLIGGFSALAARIARAAQYRRELELLMHADDRMLADIGLTRDEVVTAAQESRGWQGRRDALQAAGLRREEAMAASRARRSGLQHMLSPTLAPALPHAMETSNFR